MGTSCSLRNTCFDPMRVSWSGIKKFIKSGRKKKQTNQENILNDSCGFIVLGTWLAFFPSSQKKKTSNSLFLSKWNFFANKVMNLLLTKFVGQNSWIFVFFFFLHKPWLRLHPWKHTKKEIGQYPAILIKQA